MESLRATMEKMFVGAPEYIDLTVLADVSP
jgi:hypothetical protein